MIKQISSSANPLIREIRALDRKRQRAQSGLFIAEGARLVLEAEEAGVQPKYLLFSAEAQKRPAVRALVKRMDAAGVHCIETTERLLSLITRRDNPQNVIGVYRQLKCSLAQLDLSTRSIWVALEQVRDPGNLGTILRTADAVGAGGVILVGECCDPFSFEAVRASMGSLFAVPLASCELQDFLRWTAEGSARLIGTSLQADQRHDQLSPTSGRPQVLLMGNEQAGLTSEAAAACDELVRIPMRGRADSLNLAVATAVMLYALWGAEGYAGAAS